MLAWPRASGNSPVGAIGKGTAPSRSGFVPAPFLPGWAIVVERFPKSPFPGAGEPRRVLRCRARSTLYDELERDFADFLDMTSKGYRVFTEMVAQSPIAWPMCSLSANLSAVEKLAAAVARIMSAIFRVPVVAAAVRNTAPDVFGRSNPDLEGPSASLMPSLMVSRIRRRCRLSKRNKKPCLPPTLTSSYAPG